MAAVSHRLFVAAWLLGMTLAAHGVARAQGGAPPDQGGDPVLQALVAGALARNPALRAVQSSISAAQAEAERAGVLPDPMVSMTYTNDGWAPSLGSMPMTTLGVMGSQEFPWSGKRRLRSELAESRAREFEPALARTRLTIVAEVSRAYYGLLLARELQALTSEQRTLWQQIEIVTRARYAAGQGAQPDVLRVQTEVTRIEQRAIEQETEASVRLTEINRLLARPLDTPIDTPARLVLLPLEQTAQEAADQARAISPELAGAKLAIDTNVAAAALARRELKPDVTIQGGFMNRGGLDPMWLAGVGVSWPLNKRARRSEVAEAEIRAKGVQHTVESMASQLEWRSRERFTRAKADERLLALYDGGILPQDRMTVDSAIVNYQNGKVPFVSVLEAMTALFQDRWARTSLVADHARLVASLREASLDAGPETIQAASPAGASASTGQAGGMAGGMSGR
jgi:outer membrane protein, heavy metal efflux system